MTDAFIYDAVRTPRGRGKAEGALHPVTPVELARQTLLAVVERNRIDSALIDDVILGCVTPVGEQGANLARIAVLHSGFSETVAGVQINRFCASGLEAINMAAAKVMVEEADFAVGGGVESMSRVPMMSDGGAWATDPAVAFHTYFVPQGISADLIATKYGYSRDDVDRYAVESQKRAARAWQEDRFKKSIVPVKDILGQIVLAKDEHLRPDTNLKALAALKPSFADLGRNLGFDAVALQKYPELERVEHVHTAGNSSGVVDGSSAVLIGSQNAGKKVGLRPRARIVAMTSIGTEPTIMLTAPSLAAEKALKKAHMKKTDIDVWEINEAFAAVVLRFMEALGLDHSDININGGAIALGHPLGATGAMLLGTALDELERSQKRTALIALCIGAGMGTATIIERV